MHEVEEMGASFDEQVVREHCARKGFADRPSLISIGGVLAKAKEAAVRGVFNPNFCIACLHECDRPSIFSQ